MCLYVDDDSYGAVLLDSGTRKARKDHRCGECHRTIDPGETYRFWSWVGGDCDGFLTAKMCAHCDAILDLGVSLSGCPRQWWWEFVYDRDPEMGFVANVLDDPSHDVALADRVRLLRAWAQGRRGWRDRDGVLYPIPQVPAKAAS